MSTTNTAETSQPTSPSQERSPVDTIFGLALGYLVSRSLHVAAELGIADLLADGPRSADELSAVAGVDAPSLYRLLRTLAAHGVFAEEADGRFHLTPAAQLLRSNVFRDGVLLCGEVIGDGSWWPAVGQLRHSVTTGEPSFDYAHGATAFEYITAHPQCREWFDRGMANFSAAENPSIARSFDFSTFRTVTDVGGGKGGFLAEALRATPHLTGVLFDVAEVVADPSPLTAPDLAGRWSTATGDFFETVPVGFDAYVLKRILHDWTDEDCVRILRACRAAMTDASRLLIVDGVIPAGNDFHPAKVMDILMMVFSGRERTEAEFAQLLASAELRIDEVVQTPTTLSLIVASPV